jgi:hypothetical protein
MRSFGGSGGRLAEGPGVRGLVDGLGGNFTYYRNVSVCFQEEEEEVKSLYANHPKV